MAPRFVDFVTRVTRGRLGQRKRSAAVATHSRRYCCRGEFTEKDLGQRFDKGPLQENAD